MWMEFRWWKVFWSVLVSNVLCLTFGEKEKGARPYTWEPSKIIIIELQCFFLCKVAIKIGEEIKIYYQSC